MRIKQGEVSLRVPGRSEIGGRPRCPLPLSSEHSAWNGIIYEMNPESLESTILNAVARATADDWLACSVGDLRNRMGGDRQRCCQRHNQRDRRLDPVASAGERTIGRET